MTSVDRIQGLSGGIAIKVPCRVATTANITLSGEQTIDGIAVVDGDRVLVKNQTTGSENGIYEASTGTWTRSPDFDGANDVRTGTQVYVNVGTTNANTQWRVTTADDITIGTTSLAFGASLQGVQGEVGPAGPQGEQGIQGPAGPSGAGTGDALVALTLAQFAATTSAQLAGVISDETGSGALVFAESPTLVTPALGTPASGTLTNCSGLPAAGVAGTALVNAAIGSTVHPYDADLAAIGGLVSAANKIPMFSGAGTATLITLLDEDNMASDSATAVPTQQSVKAYVDTQSAGLYLQAVSVDISGATGVTTIPRDNTTPLIAEGTQVATLDITPADNTNLVEIHAAFNLSASDTGTVTAGSAFPCAIAALFRGNTCISVQEVYASVSVGGGLDNTTEIDGSVCFNLIDAPASASAVTYSIRVGMTSGVSDSWNCANSGRYGGTGDENQLILKEIAA